MPPQMHVVRTVSVTYYNASSSVPTKGWYFSFLVFLVLIFFFEVSPLGVRGGIMVLADYEFNGL